MSPDPENSDSPPPDTEMSENVKPLTGSEKVKVIVAVWSLFSLETLDVIVSVGGVVSGATSMI